MVDEVQPAVTDVEGWLDGVQDGTISGWAWSPRDPGEPVLVELVAGDQVIAATLANRWRGDLVEAGKRGGWCGFEFAVTEQFPRGTPISARVQRDENSPPISGEPVVLPRENVEPSQIADSPKPNRPRAPIGFSSPSGVRGHIDEFGPERIFGWVWWEHDRMRPVTILVRENGREIARIAASAWRSDLYELRQGDARCGIDAPVPDVLRDGATHLVDIVLAETEEALFPQALEVCVPPSEPAKPQPRAEPARPPRSTPILFSFIVNFYNMRREAERTLTSLTRSYQRGIEDIAYEVLCIDNGSQPPLDRSWIESFGPEFRLFRPGRVLPSPCAAINEAARKANGQYLAVMIDGAHLLTPGMLREAADAFKEHPDCIFAPRQWWLAGDQRWLSSVGFTRDLEDVLFARIGWPRDGYELFRVGAPVVESPTTWFDGMQESNCLMLPKALYERIGGMDEGFDEPGGGYANLDLFRRAATAVGDKIISPLDEASFHQFHGGTTTNVTDEEKERRVRAYANRYRELCGEPFGAVDRDRIYLRGRIRAETDLRPHWRPWITAQLGITDQIRPGNIPQHFHPKRQVYFQSVYAECALHRGTVWAGRPVRLAPADLVNIQMILDSVRPDVIVTTTRDDGLIHFLESILRAISLEGVRIVRVGTTPQADIAAPHVHAIHGSPYAPDTLSAIARAIGAAEQVVVLFEPQPDDFLPVEQISTYAGFVSFRSYFVFLGTVLGQPWLGYSRYWFATAIRTFLQQDPAFVRDQAKDEQIALMCAQGYLRRVRKRDVFETYDATLDELPV